MSSVAAVHHERRQHLPLLAEENGAAVAELEDALAFHNGLLAQPEMAVRVYYAEIQILDSHGVSSLIIAAATALEAPEPPSALRMSE